jgi:hypothetical protein
VEISGPDSFGYEITYWQIPGRTLVFVGYNPELEVSMLGGGHATSLKTGESAITLRFDRLSMMSATNAPAGNLAAAPNSPSSGA